MSETDKQAIIATVGDAQPVGNIIWLDQQILFSTDDIEASIGVAEYQLPDGAWVVKLWPDAKGANP